jgi:acyl-CoA reductase-like NAD-dependent aldehyde dehydrogenase
MIDLAGTERVEAWMERAEQLGARRLAGGDREATVLTPAVFEAEDPFVQLAGEEPLGPVAVLEPYPSLDAAVDRVNQQQSGGETCLFTRTVRKVWQVFEQLDSGSLVHDEHPNLLAERPGADGGDPRAGLGPRDLDDLTERRTLMLSFP